MRKCLVVCAILMMVCTLAFAGKQATVISAKAQHPDAKVELQNIVDQIIAAKAAGHVPDRALYARYAELMPATRPGAHHLDQGADACPATVIPSLPYTDAGSTAGLVEDFVPGSCLYSTAPDVIYEYTPTTTGNHTVSLCGSSFDTGLFIMTDGTCPGSTEVACNDDACGLQSEITTSLNAGQTYWFIVTGYDVHAGDYVINVTGPSGSGPQPGEDCTTALPLTVPGTENGNNCSFSDDLNSVCPYTTTGGRDVVYTFTPAVDEQVTFSLCRSGYDTKLYIFDGNCTGTPIACNDDASPCPGSTGSYRSYLPCVPLSGGHQYFVVVDAFSSSDCGDYVLETIVCQAYPPPPNDDCANAQPIVVNGDQICATTNGATLDCPTYLGIPEVWYSFELTECMDIVVSYCGTTAQGNLNAVLFSESCCGTPVYYSSYEYTTCADGLISLHFDHVAAGAYWLPVGFDPAGDFCVQVTGTPCPPPFECHCQDVMDGRYCNLVGGPINDVSTVDYTVNVPVQYHITDVNLCLDAIHTWDGDLTFTLVSPMGTQVIVSANHGGSGENYTCTNFDDEATTPIASGVVPFSGSFIPDNPLSAFDGENAAGDWHLMINDCCAGDIGILNWFCLTFTWDQILSVNLANYSAVPGDNSITLRWATASETNNDHFEIVRGDEVVGHVAGHNGASQTNYTWTDGAAQNGTVYNYTLVAVDVNNVRKNLGTVSATPSINAATITEYALHQNYPNPFNPTTSIAVDLVDNGFVSLKVYNLMGQEVASLINVNMTSGRHIVSFDASNLASGIYMYRLNVNGFTAEKKMVLMK
jgi:subtilisin-like proprotein convertase family protein